MRPVYLGIDIGTSGCRAVAIDAQGRTVASSSVELAASRRSGDGRVEQDPEDWWRAVISVVRTLAARLPADTRPAGLSIDGTSGSVLLIDLDGRALTPGVMYDDRRGQPHLAELAALAPARAAVHGTGASLSKVMALLAGRRTSADIRVQHQSEWLTSRLVNDHRYGDENNCLKLGYDPVERHWPDWLEGLLPGTMRPRVVAVGTPIGTVGESGAQLTGLPLGTRVIAGTTDSTAAGLAAGAIGVGDAVTSLGSTLVVKLVSARPLFAPEYGIYSHRVFDVWWVGGASNSGGRVLRHFFSDEQMRALTKELDPARPTGLDYYPLLERGERFPINDPQLEPRIKPIADPPARFFQGLLEGIARIEQAGYRRLAELGAGAPHQIFTSGGGAKNPAWTRIRERLMGVPVRSALHDQPAFGAALIAKYGCERFSG